MSSILMTVVLLVCAAPAPDTKGPSRLLDLVLERSKINTGEITVRVRFAENTRDQDLIGAIWDAHYWFVSDRSAFRLDLTRDPNKEGGAPRTTMRYAFDGKSYKIVDDVERLLPIREYIKLKPGEGPGLFPELFDPRLIGLSIDSFLAIHHGTLEDTSRIVTNAVSSKREEANGGFTETYAHKNGLTYSCVFSAEGLPIRIVVTSPVGVRPIRYEARMEYGNHPEQRGNIPTMIDFKRHDEGKLTAHEIWDIGVKQLDQPFDRSVCSWAALQPKVGAPLVIDQDYQGMNRCWTGNGFGPWKRRLERDRIQASNAPSRRTEGGSIALPAASSIALGAVLAYRMLHRIRPRA